MNRRKFDALPLAAFAPIEERISPQKSLLIVMSPNSMLTSYADKVWYRSRSFPIDHCPGVASG